MLSGNSAFTASAWVNPADTTTAWKSIFGTTCTGFDVAVNGATINFGRNCGGPDGVFYTGPTMRANEWAHIVAVFDGANIDVYKNGVKTTGGAVTYSHGATTFIGGSYSTSAELFLGKIDDVKIWNRALSAAEVASLYKQTETNVNHSQNSRLTNGLVGLWTFNGPDYNSASTTAEVLDRSGNGYHGNNSGAVPTIGKVGQGLSFSSSGSANNVLTSSFAALTSTLTMSAWIYPTSYPSERFTIVLGSGAFYMSLNSDGSLQTYWYGKSSEGYHSSGASTVPLNEWSHVVVVWNTDGPYLYVNGVLKNNIASTGTVAPNGVINIGAENTARQFLGKIDEVRVYNRALTADEIKQLYNMGK